MIDFRHYFHLYLCSSKFNFFNESVKDNSCLHIISYKIIFQTNLETKRVTFCTRVTKKQCHYFVSFSPNHWILRLKVLKATLINRLFILIINIGLFLIYNNIMHVHEKRLVSCYSTIIMIANDKRIWVRIEFNVKKITNYII